MVTALNAFPHDRWFDGGRTRRPSIFRPPAKPRMFQVQCLLGNSLKVVKTGALVGRKLCRLVRLLSVRCLLKIVRLNPGQI